MIYLISVVIVSLSVVFCSNQIGNNISGTTAPGWEFVQELLPENLVQQQDLGASIAVYHEGYPVVNLRGGWFDESQTKPYDDETLQLVFSTTKGVLAMAAALCVQRGLLDYSELVTKYWPEYGQNRKENTTVADILSHRAELPYVSSAICQYINWTAMIQTLEE
jgi:CubicO group peptidase (beta-lactamase class C family)